MHIIIEVSFYKQIVKLNYVIFYLNFKLIMMNQIIYYICKIKKEIMKYLQHIILIILH